MQSLHYLQVFLFEVLLEGDCLLSVSLWFTSEYFSQFWSLSDLAEFEVDVYFLCSIIQGCPVLLSLLSVRCYESPPLSAYQKLLFSCHNNVALVLLLEHLMNSLCGLPIPQIARIVHARLVSHVLTLLNCQL
jgi:hypothetical protein